MFNAIFGSIGSFFKTIHLTTLHAELMLGQSVAEKHQELKETRENFKITNDDVDANIAFVDSMCGYKRRTVKKD